ncbi:MAG: hypothetical protein WCP12_15065 [bacterium]
MTSTFYPVSNGEPVNSDALTCLTSSYASSGCASGELWNTGWVSAAWGTR